MKIKCDRSNPCANCRTAGIACEQAHIRRLEERLASFESGHGHASDAVEPQRPAQTPDPELLSPTGSTPQEFEGDSSFITQSMKASEMAQKTARPEDKEGRRRLAASLSELNAVLHSPAKVASGDQYRFSSRSEANYLQKLEPFPLDILMRIGNRPIFLCSWAVNDYHLVEAFCQKAYFPVEPVSSGHLASMYGILHVLMREFIILQNPLCQRCDLKTLFSTCAKNFHCLLETYDVIVAPSFESVFALTMGYTKAQDEAKPLLFTALISIAMNQCKMLGYHREVTYQKNWGTYPGAENIRRLFWTAYTFEKQTSLILGRASNIQDYDTDVQYPAVSTEVSIRPWDESFIMGIKLARIQGQIYEQMYSASGSRSCNKNQVDLVCKLCNELEVWYAELQDIDASQVNNPQIYQLSRGSWELMYYSTFVTLLRTPAAVESSSRPDGIDFASRCLQYARLSLQAHLRCFGNHRATEFLGDAEYANWVLLYSSFTPFVSVSLHCITTRIPDDLPLLEDVVESLGHIARVSQSVHRLHQICSRFAQIARESVTTNTDSSDPKHERLPSMTSGQEDAPDAGFFREFLASDLFSGQFLEASDILGTWATALPGTMDVHDVGQEIRL
ncbi:hypothetical protein BDV19DRAFT_396742 [Aspergillus venezuelensis]